MARTAQPLIVLALLAALAGVSGCVTRSPGTSRPPVLAPFSTDGCSLFPDGTFTNKTLWLDCCIEHDIAYWQGGTEEDRRNADQRLKDCIQERTGDAALAQLVYDAVRTWGGPAFPTWYRWGYGWAYGRPYGPLSGFEREQVEARLREYRAGLPGLRSPSP